MFTGMRRISAATLIAVGLRRFNAGAAIGFQGGETLKHGWAYIVDFWKTYIERSFYIGSFSISLGSIVFGFIIFIATLLVSKWLRSFLQKRLENRPHIDPGLQYTFLRLTHYLIITAGALTAFTVLADCLRICGQVILDVFN